MFNLDSKHSHIHDAWASKFFLVSLILLHQLTYLYVIYFYSIGLMSKEV